MPKNCKECNYTKTCQSFYGWHGCHYKNEIKKKGVKDHEKN